jgi:hypothetical protein
MLYNINNYISVLDIQLWMMHCLLIYYRDHYTCQNYWLQNYIFTCTYLYVLYVKSNQSNHTNQCKYCDFHVIILPIMGVFNWQINVFYSILFYKKVFTDSLMYRLHSTTKLLMPYSFVRDTIFLAHLTKRVRRSILIVSRPSSWTM